MLVACISHHHQEHNKILIIIKVILILVAAAHVSVDSAFAVWKIGHKLKACCKAWHCNWLQALTDHVAHAPHNSRDGRFTNSELEVQRSKTSPVVRNLQETKKKSKIDSVALALCSYFS